MQAADTVVPLQELQEDRVNEKVDVFSFGVVMWEIWTWAEMPYPGLGLPEIFAVITLLASLAVLQATHDTLFVQVSVCRITQQRRQGVCSAVILSFAECEHVLNVEINA